MIAEFDITTVGPPTILLIFSAGVLTSFTPCIYPLVPVTAGFIGATGVQTKGQAFTLSLAYVIGMALVYSALGAFAPLTGGIFGAGGTNPWVYLLFANLTILMGLGMLDVFTLQMPAWVASRLAALGGASRRSYLGAFTVGGSSALVAGPCTAPVLGSVLAFVATQQNVALGMLLLFSFSLGLGTLLLIVGTFSGLLKTLPKAGPWMVWVNRGFAVLFLGAGEFFLIQMGTLLI
ncbi:MAG: cytochrome c biogenesis protein CcdA [Candidatus Methylomirabilia bacterium]